MTSVSIRVADISDGSAVAELVHALIDELSGGSPPALAEMERTTATVLREPGVIAVLALVDRVPVGVMMLNECSAIYAGGRFGEISELYVRPDMRSLGVAAPLVEHARVEAKDRGWKRLELGAPEQPQWRRTLEFYLRNGFEEVGPRLRRLI